MLAGEHECVFLEYQSISHGILSYPLAVVESHQFHKELDISSSFQLFSSVHFFREKNVNYMFVAHSMHIELVRIPTSPYNVWLQSNYLYLSSSET